jgi:hypothetical protein
MNSRGALTFVLRRRHAVDVRASASRHQDREAERLTYAVLNGFVLMEGIARRQGETELERCLVV